MSNYSALDPQKSVVVEACAGSGKTWLLVSRIVRLLLDGASPSQILAITFTRKAAQEMQARLQSWLRDLALKDDAFVRQFFAERDLVELSESQLQRARGLYEQVLLAQPAITISTFHGWFMQVIQRAPLNADVMKGMTLLERPASVQEEAWEELLDQMRKQPESAEAKAMQWLFAECGLFNARELLSSFMAKRAEWWAYIEGQADPLRDTLEKLRAALDVDLAFDPVTDWGECGLSEEALYAFSHQWAANGTDTQQQNASGLERAWTDNEPASRFDVVWPLLFTQSGEPRKIKPTKKQHAENFMLTHLALVDSLQMVRDIQADQQVCRLNEAVLRCGIALLARYQAIKAQQQQMDFADLEWQLCRLLQRSDHAETMQYKLDSRYRHVLLDEFQDTNPMQWQILRAWFDAAVAVESQPTVFLVGDPKQSIYRFRRADPRLFGVAREYLVEHFAGHAEGNSATRRNAQPIVDAVNAVFRNKPEGFEFVMHDTHQNTLPGYVLVLPLCEAADEEQAEVVECETLQLRDPLTTPRQEDGEGARHQEAQQFAERLQIIVREWSVMEKDKSRRAELGDIMVLVRSRTHLAIYEEALNREHIPFISSRRGGLLDTLEAEDLQALLLFLITPFADLALAQALRTPVFACSDDDLLRLALSVPVPEAEEEQTDSSWWQRLQQLAEPTPALQRARDLLTNWLALADKLPVHDLLDRIYFDGDVLARYQAVLPAEKQAKVTANLHAFMEQALKINAGRYPSLPRFLQELRELRESADEAPDEGRLGSVGNAVRIYTVHEAKGLEAPIVWLLDANADKKMSEGNEVLLDWPPESAAPAHFSLYANLASRGKKRAPLFEQESAQQAREEMNLLYVAMTRAQQALIVSGSLSTRENRSQTWYQRIAEVVEAQPNPLHVAASRRKEETDRPDTSRTLPVVSPVGKRAARNTERQQRGIWLHALLQHIAEGAADQAELQQRLAISAEEMEPLWQQAQHLLALPQLACFFDAAQYRSASNEMSYVNAQGELKRIDRLVEFDDEVWVLDYKLGAPKVGNPLSAQADAELSHTEETSRYRAQMQEYRTAMQSVYAGKPVRCALVFADGILSEL